MAYESGKKNVYLEAGHSSSHGHSSKHGHSSSHANSSRSDKKHGKGRESGGSKNTEPNYNHHWVWSCHNCGVEGGMDIFTEDCPNCFHTRCGDCITEYVKLRDTR